MHFQHVFLRFVARIPEDTLKNHRYVAHQIDRIIVNHDLPRYIERFFLTCFLLDCRNGNIWRRRALWTHHC